MKAMVLTEISRLEENKAPLEVADLSVPVPGENEILVRVGKIQQVDRDSSSVVAILCLVLNPIRGPCRGRALIHGRIRTCLPDS